MKTTKVIYNGIGLPGLLATIFIVLKLTNVITWSWWWVLCPLWIPFAIYMAIIFIVIIFIMFKRL